MGTTMNKEAFDKLVIEDIEWLEEHAPKGLERDHILSILLWQRDMQDGESMWGDAGTRLVLGRLSEKSIERLTSETKVNLNMKWKAVETPQQKLEGLRKRIEELEKERAELEKITAPYDTPAINALEIAAAYLKAVQNSGMVWGICPSEAFVELIDKVEELETEITQLRTDKIQLDKLLDLTENEGSDGKFAIVLEWNNYQDVAIVRRLDGEILSECISGEVEGGDLLESENELPNAMFKKAIERACGK